MNMVMRLPLILRGSAMAVGLFLAMSPPSAAETLLPVPFQMTETGQMRDPTGLWSPSEVAEGGSDVQPSVWFATFPVQGGTVALAVLVDAWCGIADCPMRFRLVDDDGPDLRNFTTVEYDMVCQAPELFFYDPEARLLHHCDAPLSLAPEE